MAKTPGRVATLRKVKADTDGRPGQFGDDRAGPLIGKIRAGFTRPEVRVSGVILYSSFRGRAPILGDQID